MKTVFVVYDLYFSIEMIFANEKDAKLYLMNTDDFFAYLPNTEEEKEEFMKGYFSEFIREFEVF